MPELPNLKKEKNPMPVQSPKKRIKNFDEVALGYDEKTAIDEAKRCLNCVNMPCVSGCPVKIHIPEFIKKVKEMDFEGAYQVLQKSSMLSAVCGRVCPQERQCEQKCVRGINGEPVGIGRLERFVADWHNQFGKKRKTKITKNGHKVAIIGSGPSGLACASDLAFLGYDVTIFEALHKAGGVLLYGIPEFRLPKHILNQQIQALEKLGVKIQTNIVVGKVFTIEELFQNGFEAVFIGSGAGLPRFMNILGESLNGVYSANEFLTRSNLMRAYEKNATTPIMKGGTYAVVGGGNVAMDAARTAVRLNAKKVYVIYRRSEEELPARKEEVEHAKEEGIEFLFLTNPIEILGYQNKNDLKDPKNGFVKSIKCQKMELTEADESGRRKPVPIKNSEFELDVDSVIMAIGTSPNPLIKESTKKLKINDHGGIVVNEKTCATNLKGVFAGGDAVTGAATVISAMGAGKLAAKSIDEFIQKKNK